MLESFTDLEWQDKKSSSNQNPLFANPQVRRIRVNNDTSKSRDTWTEEKKKIRV